MQSSDKAYRGRFHLSLRDVFILITSVCIMFSVFAIHPNLTATEKGIFNALIPLVMMLTVLVLLAVAFSNTAKYRSVLTFVAVFMLLVVFSYTTHLVMEPYEVILGGPAGIDPTMEYAKLTRMFFCLYVALLCSWITRSLQPPAVEAMTARGE